MIRRDDGGDWIIIEQIKHASLATEIARVGERAVRATHTQWRGTILTR